MFADRCAFEKINIVEPVSNLYTHVLYAYRIMCVMNVRFVFLRKRILFQQIKPVWNG